MKRVPVLFSKLSVTALFLLIVGAGPWSLDAPLSGVPSARLDKMP
jgi:hypothetical protein